MSHVTDTPTLQQSVRTLLVSAGQQANDLSKHLAEVPLAWEGARNAIDRLHGLEVAEIVLRDQGLLEASDIDDLREATTTLRAARMTLMAIGDNRKAAAVEEVWKVVAHRIEKHYTAHAIGANA